MEDPTVETGDTPDVFATRALLVVGGGHMSTHPISDRATFVLGREPSCDVVIDHPKVSRRHAIVRAVASEVTIEDAGGMNRVHVGDRTLAPGERAVLAPGTSCQIGPCTVVVLGVPSPVGESIEGRAALVIRDAQQATRGELIGRVAASETSVLIRGETGSGKEVLARGIHEASGRTGPFIAINCATLHDTLLESELFGYERGAFTNAIAAKPGLFETAAGGTVFLDEVAELPLLVQAKLLRAIETREVMRLGGTRPIALDVRFLAATHRDLREHVAHGAFRQDLYFRINGITLVLVPLRDRKDMLPQLASQLLAAAAERAKRRVPTLSHAALDLLLRHDWPGNVRELRVVLERALLLAEGDEFLPKHIVIDSVVSPSRPAPSSGDAGLEASEAEERARIIDALQRCAGNQTRAAKLLGISRGTLSSRISILRIPRPRK